MEAEAEAEDVGSVLATLQKWTPAERAAYCETVDGVDVGGDLLHPLFMTASPSEAVVKATPVLSALATMAYDEEDTPAGMARAAKGRGNEAYSKGPEFFGHAIKHYNDALTHAEAALAGKGGGRLKADGRTEMRALLGAVWGNLAAIYLARGKHITVLSCCDKSLQAVPNNVKVLFRAAKSSLTLGRAKAARDFTRLALAQDADNLALRALAGEADKALAVQRAHAAAAEREYESRLYRIAQVRLAVEERALRMGPPMYRNMRRTNAYPYIDSEDAAMHWPVLLLYPQYHQSDWVEDVSERASLSDIVAHVLGEEGSGMPPPAWDKRGEYRIDNVDVFFLSNPCKSTAAALTTAWQEYIDDAKPAGERAAAEAAGAATAADDDDIEINWGAASQMVRIPPAAPLLLPLLQPTYVVADIPVFYIVARSSDLYSEMRRRAGGRFAEVAVNLSPAM